MKGAFPFCLAKHISWFYQWVAFRFFQPNKAARIWQKRPVHLGEGEFTEVKLFMSNEHTIFITETYSSGCFQHTLILCAFCTGRDAMIHRCSYAKQHIGSTNPRTHSQISMTEQRTSSERCDRNYKAAPSRAVFNPTKV